MPRRSLSVLALSVIVFACFAFRASHGQPDAQAPNNDEFAGKIVTVYLNLQDPDVGQVLEDVEIREVGGRKFLVGTGVDTGHEENWTSGVHVGIAWESVQIYYAMDEEQYRQKMEAYGDRR